MTIHGMACVSHSMMGKDGTNTQDQNLLAMLPIDGRSGNLMSLIRCGMFISLTAETARAGAAAIPA